MWEIINENTLGFVSATCHLHNCYKQKSWKTIMHTSQNLFIHIKQTYAQIQAITHPHSYVHTFLYMNIQKSISTQLHKHYIIITIQ